MDLLFWTVVEHAALTTAVRAALLSRYSYSAPAEHTYAAIVSVRRELLGGIQIVVDFPFSFIAATYIGNTSGLEAAIDAECAARLAVIRNAEPLTSIVGRRHWL